MRAFAPLAVATLAACGSFDAEGQWIGACDTAGVGMHLEAWISVVEPEDETLGAQVLIARPDRPDTSLSLVCEQVDQVGRDVVVDACSGDWEGGQTPHDFALDGRIGAGDLVDEMTGDCTADGLSGAVDLWKMP